ncbi:MAG TPA: NAD-glutamate dehydrogenase, partial [Rhizobiaceae bacterium]|nr:NAD-glutamate dehydrogenase [Rhizobiaceae bacterium]
MARMLNAENKRILAGISRLLTFENRDLPVLSDALFGQANPEDLAPFEPEALAVAVRVAAAMIADHRKGQSLVDVSSPDDFRCGDEQATLVTLVNDNMPFLLDSVLGEINDHTRDVLLVVHPILDVAREGEGYEIIDKSRPGLSREQTHRTSVIQIAIAHQPAETCADLARRLNVIMGQVRAAVRDWPAMLGRIAELVGVYAAGAVPLKQTDVREAMAFLEWLRDDNFTFLGIRDYDYTGNERQGDLVRSQRPALGVLSDPDFRILRRGSDPITITPEIRAFLNSREPLIVTKANAKSMVHRRGYLDYIGVKRYGDDGKLAGETRIVGLFTSTAYTKSVKTIPYLRSKVDTVMARSGHDPESHSGKALLNVLEHYPRDELFQIDTQTLARNSEAILALADRSRVRVLARPDPFDRFVSVLVHVPRDRYDSLVRQRIAACLVKEFDGRLSAFYPSFPEGPHARVHFIIGRSGGKAPKVSEAQLEADVRCIIHTWEDAWNEEIRRGGPQQSALLPLASSFPPSYREVFDAAQALIDARQLLRVDAQNTIAFDFYRDADEAENTAALRIYHHGAPVPLSARVPMLENLGFRVISEQTFELARPDGDQVYLHDMKLESGLNREIDLSDEGVQFEDALHAVWSGSADNDGYNMLVQVAGLPWREVSVLRAYGRYLRQAGIAYSPGLLADTLVRHPKVCRDLVELFRSRFDPAAIAEGDASERERAARQRIEVDQRGRRRAGE